MIKAIFLPLIACIFLFNPTYAQKSFNVTIKIDSGIDPQNIHYQYYNGKGRIFLPDTFGKQRVIVLKGLFYSQSASFTINYFAAPGYENDFFIDDKPAFIHLHFKANDTTVIETYLKNAVPIFDSAANKSWARFIKFSNTDTATLKINTDLMNFIKQNHQFAKSDSLLKKYRALNKKRLNGMMLFLKKYPDDYFSFYYFIDQIADPSFLEKDTSFLSQQLTYVKEVFPARFTESVEGKELIKTYEAILNPLKLNARVPQFTIKTIDGKRLNLSDLKGKYVLLDFWATWCGPCMNEIPFIKSIRESYPPEKLLIIGISQDRDLNALNRVIKQRNMNWLHYYDINTEISRLYGVSNFPTLILLSKTGNIIYKSDFIKNDSEALPQLLKTLD